MIPSPGVEHPECTLQRILGTGEDHLKLGEQKPPEIGDNSIRPHINGPHNRTNHLRVEAAPALLIDREISRCERITQRKFENFLSPRGRKGSIKS